MKIHNAKGCLLFIEKQLMATTKREMRKPVRPQPTVRQFLMGARPPDLFL